MVKNEKIDPPQSQSSKTTSMTTTTTGKNDNKVIRHVLVSVQWSFSI